MNNIDNVDGLEHIFYKLNEINETLKLINENLALLSKNAETKEERDEHFMRVLSLRNL